MNLETSLPPHYLAFPLWLVGLVSYLGLQGFAYLGRFRAVLTRWRTQGRGAWPPTPRHVIGTPLGQGDGVSFWIACVTFVTLLVGQGSNLQPAD